MAAPAYMSELELAARRKGAQRRHSVSTYVKSIVRRADELTATDLEALRALIKPDVVVPGEGGDSR